MQFVKVTNEEGREILLNPQSIVWIEAKGENHSVVETTRGILNLSENLEQLRARLSAR